MGGARGGRRACPPGWNEGFSLLELLFVMGLGATLVAGAVPYLTRGVDASRARAAARYLAHQCGLARFQAVAASRTVAIRFTARGDDYDIQMFADGNRNGVRSLDIERGVDTPLAPPTSLGTEYPGVRIGVEPDVGGDPLRLGGTTLLSFTPVGTATSGSVYVAGRDGSQYVVRVLGATARTRVLRYAPDTRTWVEP